MRSRLDLNEMCGPSSYLQAAKNNESAIAATNNLFILYIITNKSNGGSRNYASLIS
jgi:hypothetical protein